MQILNKKNWLHFKTKLTFEHNIYSSESHVHCFLGEMTKSWNDTKPPLSKS